MNLSTCNRPLAGQTVPAVGLGCMNLSHAYGIPPEQADAERVLHKALEIGVRHFDTAPLYGFGRNEDLLGPVLKPVRDEIFLASKCGLTGVNGERVIDGRPETLMKTCDESLRKLQTEVLDLYYLHRWDKNVPIEDSIGALQDMRRQGKIRAIGLCEVSADTLRHAHAIEPIAAVQSEYSLWSRNAEIAVLDACRELDVAYVAFSPLARGFFANMELSPDEFVEKDIRRNMPRFQSPHFEKNRELLGRYRALADAAGCTPAQLALAWLLHKAPNLHVLPGTTSCEHLEEDFAARDVSLSRQLMDELEALIDPSAISGPRYNAATQAQIDTEEFPAAATE
ncbi:MAG TPA: aldo/keto reductase [Gammaproteobacteria bacterium]